MQQAGACLSDASQKSAYDVALLREQIVTEPHAANVTPLPENGELVHDRHKHERSLKDHQVQVLNEADEHQMMVVAENLSDSQAAMLKSKLATLRPKSGSSSAISTGTYRGPRPSSSPAPAVRKARGNTDRARTAAISALAIVVALFGYLASERLLREPPAPDPVAPLLAKLADRDAIVRAAAANDLGKMGPRMVEAVPSLVKTLETDPSDEVRLAAAQALAEAGPTLVGVVPQLAHMVDREQNETVRRMIKGLIQSSEGPR